jgi:hypothetical protein
VTQIQLQHQHIQGVIPPTIGYLQELQILNLEDNLMEGEIPESLGLLSKLHTLVLSNNGFQGSIPAAILDLNLTTFDINNTQLMGHVSPNRLNSSHFQSQCDQQPCFDQTACIGTCSMAISSASSTSSMDLPLMVALMILGLLLFVGIIFAAMLHHRWKRQKQKEQQLYMYEMNYSFVQAPLPAHTVQEQVEPIEPLLERKDGEKPRTDSSIFKITAAELDIEEKHYQYTPKAKNKQENNGFLSMLKNKLFPKK